MALVYVVDDEASIRELVRINLELDGHEVEVAADGAEALAAVADGLRPDIVMLDLMMPELDGWEVIRRLKADPDPEVAATPVVLLTAKASDLDRIRGGIEGALSYVTKPFELGDLSQAVDAALEADEAQARLAAQTSALQHLVRLEKGETVTTGAGAVPATSRGRRVRFSRLERRPDGPSPAPEPATTTSPPDLPLDLSRLTPQQRNVLQAMGEYPTVRLAAAALGISRSNVYASLRRIAAKFNVASSQELIALIRERSD